MSWIRDKVRTFFDVSFMFIIYYMVGVAIHEFMHYNIGSMLGYTPSAHFTWVSGYVTFTPSFTVPDAIMIGIAGGLGVCIFYVLLSYFTSDWESDLALQFFAVLHGVYSVHEVLWVLGKIPKELMAFVPIIFASVWAIYFEFHRKQEGLGRTRPRSFERVKL
jgi:hypothetical protein